MHYRFVNKRRHRRHTVTWDQLSKKSVRYSHEAKSSASCTFHVLLRTSPTGPLSHACGNLYNVIFGFFVSTAHLSLLPWCFEANIQRKLNDTAQTICLTGVVMTNHEITINSIPEQNRLMAILLFFFSSSLRRDTWVSCMEKLWGTRRGHHQNTEVVEK